MIPRLLRGYLAVFACAAGSLLAQSSQDKGQDLNQLITSAEDDLKLAQLEHSLPREARAMQTIGDSYRSMGQPKSAIQFLNRTLEIHISANDPIGQAEALNSLAETQNDMESDRGFRLPACRSRHTPDRPNLVCWT